jgi:ABC-2 type transport system permease protein
VNWQHFQTFLWLRWRLLVNQLKRGGAANVVVIALLGAGGAALSAALVVTFFLVGLTLGDVPPLVLLYVWDGLVVGFLFAWMTGLLVELQRSEVLSLEKFLHLPVSLRGVFLFNYLGSFFSVSLLLFLPAMVALALALVFSRGPALLLVPPLLAAFVFAVTAVTYQFQGWLAALMANKRRRRTVIVLVTLGFVLFFQVPNLLNILHPWDGGEEHSQQAVLVVWYLNVLVPLGWLPAGAMAAAEGNVLPAVLGTLGLALIGGGSLWRSYRTTVRYYTGQFGSGKTAAVAVPTLPSACEGRPLAGSGSAAPAAAGPPRTLLLERRLPWVSEQAAAVALGGLRSLTRAPEAKMMLLTPVIMVLVFGSLFFARPDKPADEFRPLMAFGALSMTVFSMGQLVGNQFGFDRDGFRVFVLSAAPRRDILLGKNLAFAPLALGLGVFLVGVLQAVFPLRIEHLLATLPQWLSMFLLFCLMANWLSMLAPMPIRSGSLKPVNPKLIPSLLQVVFLLLLPFVFLPLLIPWGVGTAAEKLGWAHGVPICLLLSLVECLVVVGLYFLVLGWQGHVLQAREKRILEVVTTRSE